MTGRTNGKGAASYAETFTIEVERWLQRLRNSPAEISPAKVHEVLRDLAPAFELALRLGHSFDVIKLSHQFVEATRGKVEPKDAALGMLAQLPDPKTLDAKSKGTYAHVVDQVERHYGGAWEWLRAKLEGRDRALSMVDEIVGMEIEAWRYGLSGYPGQPYGGLLHAILKEIRPSLLLALTQGLVVDIPEIAGALASAFQHVAARREVVLSIVVNLPHPDSCPTLERSTLFATLERVAEAFPDIDVAARLRRKWEHERTHGEKA